jgi:hypothetical protein
LMMVAYLDPRVSYTGEIRLLDNGKRVDVDGLFFSTYVADPSVLGSGDIVKAYNQYTNGGKRLSVSTFVITVSPGKSALTLDRRFARSTLDSMYARCSLSFHRYPYGIQTCPGYTLLLDAHKGGQDWSAA